MIFGRSESDADGHLVLWPLSGVLERHLGRRDTLKLRGLRMTTIAFDTLRFANRLKAAGVPDKQAEAEAEALAEVLEVNLKEFPLSKIFENSKSSWMQKSVRAN